MNFCCFLFVVFCFLFLCFFVFFSNFFCALISRTVYEFVCVYVITFFTNCGAIVLMGVYGKDVSHIPVLCFLITKVELHNICLRFSLRRHASN